ncbi:MAG: hypothetical protein WC365_08460 [Candidatus Babeliales bacterium]|jgi:hypothetical protein
MKPKAKQEILNLIAQRNRLREKKNEMELMPADKWTDKLELEWLILKDELSDAESALSSAVVNRETL